MNPATRKETAEPRFRAAFLKPRFWGTWCGLLLLRIAMHLPRRWVMAIGGLLGDQLRARHKKRRRIAEINLALCFPELDERERRRLLVAHFRQYGRGLMDMALALWASPARLDRWCRLERREWLRRLLRRRRVILVAYHMTTLDLGGCMLARVHPYVAMMKRDRNPLLAWQLWRGRTRLDKANIRLVMRDQGMRPLVRGLQAGRLCIIVPDEDLGSSKRAVFAPFFGVRASTLTVVSRLAKLTGALVLPSATRLDPRTGHYVMRLGDPLENFPGADPEADAAALNRAMETLIRRAPEQYMWTFRWFKTRPDGEPSPYPGGRRKRRKRSKRSKQAESGR